MCNKVRNTISQAWYMQLRFKESARKMRILLLWCLINMQTIISVYSFSEMPELHKKSGKTNIANINYL